MKKYGTIKSIEEVTDLRTSPVHGSINNPGLAQTLNALFGHSSMDGYRITTDETDILVLIDSCQCCCENWGYFASEDDFTHFMGAEITAINLTDTALNEKKVEESGWYEDYGGIQFVDFVTNKGVLQLAVYNAHNGYYGHGIAIAVGDKVICDGAV